MKLLNCQPSRIEWLVDGKTSTRQTFAQWAKQYATRKEKVNRKNIMAMKELSRERAGKSFSTCYIKNFEDREIHIHQISLKLSVWSTV